MIYQPFTPYHRAIISVLCCHPFLTRSFYSGPWVYSPTYANLASATVVGPGLYSNKAIQLHANSGPNDPTSASTFSQTINLCKNSLFQLKWSMVQNKGGTTYDSKHPYYPEAYIYVKSPDGLQYPLADFRFSTTNYNYTVFSTSSSTKTGSHPVSQWTNYTADFPKTQVGNWVVQVQWFTAVGSGATANSTFTAKFDDFAVKLK